MIVIVIAIVIAIAITRAAPIVIANAAGAVGARPVKIGADDRLGAAAREFA